MANPEYEETLDVLDKLSVVLYRLGITIFSMTAVLYAAALVSHEGWLVLPHVSESSTDQLFVFATVMCAANIHVYSKTVRTVIAWSGWIGVLLMMGDLGSFYHSLSLGFMFITFSGIALKESFCFRIIGLKLVPVLLVVGVVGLLLEGWGMAGIALGFAGGELLYLAISKWKMPLHFDIGIKANYQF